MQQVAYDAATPPLALMLASDAVVINCYTDGMYGYQPGWIREIVDAGKGVYANHENAENELFGGYDAGVKAAQKAMNAVSRWPVMVPNICYSVDLYVDPSSKEFAACLQAFQGIYDTHKGIYTASCYGEGALIETLAQEGLTQKGGWLAKSTGFPGYNPTSPFVAMYQLMQTDIPGTDKNVITDLTNLGAWLHPDAPPSKEDTMVYNIYTNTTDGDPNFGASFIDEGGGYAPALTQLQYQTWEGLGGDYVKFKGLDANAWHRMWAMLNSVTPPPQSNGQSLP